MQGINFKRKNGKKKAVTHVLQNTQNLVVSRYSFEEDGYEMYKDL